MRELETPSAMSTSPPSSPNAMASPQPPSSGYLALYLSTASSDPDYSWLSVRPPRLSLRPQASFPELSAPPHPSSSSSSEIPSSPQHAWWDWETSETHSTPHRFTLSHHPSSLSSTDPFLWHSDAAMSTPVSGGSLHSLYVSASDGLAPSHNSISEGSAPSRNSISKGSQSSLPPPPTERCPRRMRNY
jgi:hypothetical protein